MKRKAVPFQMDSRAYHLTLEAVPASVCKQCGEVYSEEREVDRIQDVIRETSQRTEELGASL